MNVLMVWELGTGLGHTIPLAAIGTCLIGNGHHVSYALRNPKTADAADIEPNVDVCAAPFMGVFRQNWKAAYDCADMLLLRGYEMPDRLDERLDSWLRIFERFSPDTIVTDHAPSARLAANIAGIPTHAIGNGFAVPPLTSPLQPFIHPPNSHVTKQQEAENRLNDAINATLRRYDRPEIDRAVNLFFGGSTFLITLEELDNYNNRQGSVYYGPPFRDSTGASPQWPTDASKRVFVYLYPDAPVLPKVLTGLDQLGVSTVVYVGSNGTSDLANLATRNVVFTEQSFALTEPSTQCDLVICQGGGNTMVTSLLRGIPLLTYPRHVEQQMACRRLKSQRLAEILDSTSDQHTVNQTILRCLNSESLHKCAGEFACKYRSFDGRNVAKSIAEQISLRMPQ